MEHTKGKWYINGRFIMSYAKKTIAELPQGEIVHNNIDKANAQRIVHCVNTYDELLEACKKANRALNEAMSEIGYHKMIDDAYNLTEQALGKCKEQDNGM